MHTGVTDERLYNAIGAVFSQLHKGVDPQAQMAQIRERYPSPVFFVESNAFMLKRAGLAKLDAFYFTLIPGLARHDRREAFGKKPKLNVLSAMADYLKTLFIGIHVECFYAILLDARGYLMDAVLIRKGTTESAPFDLREMMSLVVQRGARAVVLCHNHPRGTLRPSREDVACTLRAMGALMALNVPLIDHVIVAQSHAVSMRQCGAVASKLWTMQAPDDRLLRRWLDRELLDEIDEAEK